MKARRYVAALLAVLGLVGSFATPAQAEERRASVSGTVYFDANVNGRPDPTERAVRNIQVDLDGPSYNESRKTGENGTFEFSGLAGGRYTIKVKLPTGYGLSQGENNKEIVLDGHTAVKTWDYGIARAELIPSPTASVTIVAPPMPTLVPATATPPPPAPVAPAAPPSGGPSFSPGGGSPFGGRSAAPPQPTATTPPTPTTPPTATVPPATAQPTSTIEPTPTRTPPPLEGLQVAAERARSALSAPVAPHLGSTRDGQNVLLDVPFRSALDGSDYADTNSGTAAVAMALEAYGFNVPTADLRALANTLTRTYDVSQPPRIDTLVRVGEQVGLRGLGLFQGVRFTVWSVDNVRDRVRAGYPVLTQIRLDGPPADGELGRERFVLIVGIQDENLVYHDPAYPGQQGAARTMPASGLLKAWVNSPGSSQAAAFALSPTELGLFATRDQLVAAQVQPEKQPTPETRDVPTPGPGQLLGPLAQLIPVSPTDSVPAAAAAAAADSGLPFHPPQLHPMLFLFCVVGGVVLLKVVASLIFD